MKQKKIIISKNSIKKELYDIVYSNVTVVNLLLDEGIKETDIHPDALLSYYCDYYQAQVENGGFSQYVYNSKWKDIVNERVANGLEKMGAVKHLAFFNKRKKAVEQIPKEKIDAFLANEYFGKKNETRDQLNFDDFFDIDENISDLNGTWLKTHPETIILSIEDMFSAIEQIVGHKIER